MTSFLRGLAGHRGVALSAPNLDRDLAVVLVALEEELDVGGGILGCGDRVPQHVLGVLPAVDGDQRHARGDARDSTRSCPG